MEEGRIVYLTSLEVAAKLGCSVATVARAARRASCGVYVHGGRRLVALHPQDVDKMRSVIHETSGNPVWIAGKRS